MGKKRYRNKNNRGNRNNSNDSFLVLVSLLAPVADLAIKYFVEMAYNDWFKKPEPEQSESKIYEISEDSKELPSYSE
jgi:hypothetical protein